MGKFTMISSIRTTILAHETVDNYFYSITAIYDPERNSRVEFYQYTVQRVNVDEVLDGIVYESQFTDRELVEAYYDRKIISAAHEVVKRDLNAKLAK
jgi:hypothetical protein